MGYFCLILTFRVAYARGTFNEDISGWDTSSVSVNLHWIYLRQVIVLLIHLFLRLQIWLMRKFGSKEKNKSGKVIRPEAFSSALTPLSNSFYGAAKFTGGDLSGWVTSKVTSMDNM